MIFDDILKRRALPTLDFNSKEEFIKKRQEIKETLQKNEYGYIPDKPEHLSVKLSEEEWRYAGGKAKKQNLIMTLYSGGRSFSFPFCAVIPHKDGKIPAFIYIAPRREVPDRYLPSEEIADNGFAVFSFCSNDIIADNENFKGDLPSFLGINRRSSASPGKIALWAYAAMRIMDHVQTLDFIDKDNIAVIGHSRLGKAALLAAAFDDRFKYAIANDSGCSGAAITRGKSGESVHDITNRFPFWFCPKYARLAADFEDSDFDQNFLLALIVPRKLVIGSAENDLWSDPESEFLGAYSVSKLYELYGIPGLICENEFPKAPALLDKGNICYHIRKGEHYLTRDDWHAYMSYIKKNMERKL